MKYLWYGLLALASIGFLGLIVSVAGVVYIFSYYGQDLPDYSQLKDYKPPIVTRLYAGDGRLMAEFAQEKRVFVPIEKIPVLVKNAFISAEDKNFYAHDGVDFIAIARAGVSNIRNMGSGRRPEGASTITQQVAKNFLLTNEVSIERKIKEAILAYRIERAMPKERLLELYLNEIYMGARAYGVAAAALRYFDKALDELEIHEAAYLASLPKAPNNYHPEKHHEAALERRNWVLERLEVDGHITDEQREIAQEKPLQVNWRDGSNSVQGPYFAEEVRRFLGQQYGEDSLYGGGMVVRGTLDPRLQGIAGQALREGLMAYDKRHGWRGPIITLETIENWREQLKTVSIPAGKLDHWRVAVVKKATASKASLGFEDGSEGYIKLENLGWAKKSLRNGYQQGPPVSSVTQVLRKGNVIFVEPWEEEGSYALRQIPLIQGAIVAMDPHTGRVLAMQGGWRYGISEFNRATQAKRQPGSAFKPFVYLAALEHGFTPATLVLDAPFAIQDRPGNIWSPTNYTNEYYGPTPIRVGVEKSKNLMTVRLADYLGLDMIAQYAQKFGIDEDMKPLHANALGASETTLLDLTSAYAVFVNGGKKVKPTLIDRIQDRRGDTIYRHDDRPCDYCGDRLRWDGQLVPDIPDTREQLTDPRHAYQMVSILEGVVQRGTGIRIRSLNRPLAGKTGTTNDSNDAWFIGFSSDLVVGVFTGFDEPRSLGRRETGSSVAVPIFKDFMEQALEDMPPTPFRMPPGLRNVQINAKTGARAKPEDEKVIWEVFLEGTEPTDEKYILDGRGISVMPSVGISVGAPGEEAATGTGGIY